ncbi:MAG: hypothetical protein JSR58_06705 [Verrucomicrobia bacterium]|nr:hypothetical protein [Verrucomicrobiota bacterium]
MTTRITFQSQSQYALNKNNSPKKTIEKKPLIKQQINALALASVKTNNLKKSYCAPKETTTMEVMETVKVVHIPLKTQLEMMEQMMMNCYFPEKNKTNLGSN